jgi:GNAT superfamily N-acetyltransferase
MSEIRLADIHDEFEIFKLCSMMHAEQPYHPLDWDKVIPMIRLATTRERGIIGVVGDRYDLKAAIFLLLEPIWYSSDWQLLEFFNYVRPDARRSNIAKELIAYARSCADRLGVDFTCGVFSNIRTEAKCRLYRRMLPKMGEFFCYSPAPRIAAMEQAFRELSAQPAANNMPAE